MDDTAALSVHTCQLVLRLHCRPRCHSCRGTRASWATHLSECLYRALGKPTTQ